MLYSILLDKIRPLAAQASKEFDEYLLQPAFCREQLRSSAAKHCQYPGIITSSFRIAAESAVVLPRLINLINWLANCKNPEEPGRILLSSEMDPMDEITSAAVKFQDEQFTMFFAKRKLVLSEPISVHLRGDARRQAILHHETKHIEYGTNDYVKSVFDPCSVVRHTNGGMYFVRSVHGEDSNFSAGLNALGKISKLLKELPKNKHDRLKKLFSVVLHKDIGNIEQEIDRKLGQAFKDLEADMNRAFGPVGRVYPPGMPDNRYRDIIPATGSDTYRYRAR